MSIHRTDGVGGTFQCRNPAIGPACETQCEKCAAGVAEVPAPKRHALCGKCMTPHICAEDGPGCAAGVGGTDGR